MSLDIARLRAETPGCAHVLHLNAAGSALPSRRTLDATLDHLRLEAEIGGYEAAAKAHDELKGFYRRGPADRRGGRRDRLRRERHARLGPRLLFPRLQAGRSHPDLQERVFVELHLLPPGGEEDRGGDRGGPRRQLRPDQSRRARARHRQAHQTGVDLARTDAGRLGAAGRGSRQDAGVLYLLDACQSVGQLPVDVGKIGCDFLSMTGRKYLRGPRGTGFLYARRTTTANIEPIFLDNYAAKWTDDNAYTTRGDARRFENWERYFAGVIGLKVATDQANELGPEPIWARLRTLADGLRARLSTLKGVTLTDLGKVKGAIVTFAVAGADHAALRDRLRAQAINVTVSTQFSSRLDLKGRGLRDVMRASVHVYNTEEELDRFVAAVEAIT